MTALADYQFEFEGYAFGLDLPIATNEDGFNPGSDSWVVQDVFNEFTDSIGFGVDAVQPAPWSWQVHTNTARFADDALEDLKALALVWEDPKWRSRAGVVAPLRYRIGHRDRVVFGRPRVQAPILGNGLVRGYLETQLEFQRADRFFYDDEVLSVNVGAQPQESTGFITPLTFPLTTLQGDVVPGATVIPGGDRGAPFEATFTGPVVNPRLVGDGWEVQLMMTIESGESVTVSTYPWGNRAVRDDGANVSGRLSAKTRLAKARLNPAGETMTFDGIDSSGTATCSVSWRATYSTI